MTIPTEAVESSTDGQTEIAVEMLSEDRAAAEASWQIPPFELEELRRQLRGMREQGFLPPVDTPDDAPILLVQKEDGGIRVCVDYSM